MDKRLLDKTWRLSHLYKIITKQGELITFKPNRAQLHYLKNFHSRNIILKSRQLGFTTLQAIDALDDVLFTPSYNALLIAHRLDDANAIFDSKVDLAWRNFPKELQPLWGVATDNARQLQYDFGDGTRSSFVVSTSGRSGTFQRVHISEFGKIAAAYPTKAREIITGTIPAIPVTGRVDIESTAEGDEGIFYDMFHKFYGKEPQHPLEYKVHFYNWTWDDVDIELLSQPVKHLPKEFIDLQKEHTLTDKQIHYYYWKWQSLGGDWARLRQEYPTTAVEAFETSLEGTYYTAILDQMVQEGRISQDVQYDPKLTVQTFWDVGLDGTAVWFVQQHNDQVRLIDFYFAQDKSFQDCAADIAGIVNKKKYPVERHVPPHDLYRSEYFAAKTSRKDIAKEAGIRFVDRDLVVEGRFDEGIDAVYKMLPRIYINSETCRQGLQFLRRYKRKWNATKGAFMVEHEHDINSHAADALRYLAINIRGRAQAKGAEHRKASISEVLAVLNNG